MHLVAIVILFFMSGCTGTQIRTPIPALADACSLWICYYGPITDEVLESLSKFKLAVIHPEQATPAQVAQLQKGGTVVLAYLSTMEEQLDGLPPLVGDGLGPTCWDGTKRVYENLNVSSYYWDVDCDGHVDVMEPWGSYICDTGNAVWRQMVKTNTEHWFGADYILNTLGCDGLFLDTAGDSSPWGRYAFTAYDTADFIRDLSQSYPLDKYLMLNGCIYFVEKQLYANVVRPNINAMCWEDYYSTWNFTTNQGEVSPNFSDNKYNWAPLLNQQAAMPDGYSVVSLDYWLPSQTAQIRQDINETIVTQKWNAYITDVSLGAIRWEVAQYCNSSLRS
eukprot:TRINITY_DN671_c0_g1_i1.p1 TRINITY_DN671_c0_g1~~TRINITY_DN671_c0_g1_i1.p1  ORF type:complete len:335 (+),score=88.57 TRINITY_DN671_c0_g1_i1:36-1040(+)